MDDGQQWMAAAQPNLSVLPGYAADVTFMSLREAISSQIELRDARNDKHNSFCKTQD
jgi:hypothetical protein